MGKNNQQRRSGSSPRKKKHKYQRQQTLDAIIERNEIERATASTEKEKHSDRAAAVVTATRDPGGTPRRSNVNDVKKKLTYSETDEEYPQVDEEGYACTSRHQRRGESDKNFITRMKITARKLQRQQMMDVIIERNESVRAKAMVKITQINQSLGEVNGHDLTEDDTKIDGDFPHTDSEGYACTRLQRRRGESDELYDARMTIKKADFEIVEANKEKVEEEDEARKQIAEAILNNAAEKDATGTDENGATNHDNTVAEDEARRKFDEAISQTAAEAEEADILTAQLRQEGVATDDDAEMQDGEEDDDSEGQSDDETATVIGSDGESNQTNEGNSSDGDGETTTLADNDEQVADEGSTNDVTTADNNATATETTESTNADEKENATEDMELDSTEGLINRHFPRLTGVTRRKYFRRYDLKVTVPPATDANVKLLEQFRSFFKKVKESDTKAFIAPYSTTNNNEKAYCHGPDSIPETVTGMRQYFEGARPMVKGGTLYARVLLAHDKDFFEIKDDISWSFESDAMGFWERPCQSDSTMELGWLLYSLRSMDIDILKEALEKLTSCAIGLRWRAITTGDKWTANRKQEDIARAIHIEINEQDQGKAHAKLQDLYSSTRKTGFPLGIQMRLIPGITRLMNPDARVNVKHLATRQTTFTAQVNGATNWEVQTIDRTDPSSGKSLRDAMMSIKSKSLPHLSVFFSVFQTFKQTSYRFQFLPQLATEAQTIIAGLLPILQHFHGTWVEKYFTPSAIARAQDCTWDPETEQVVSPNDEIIGAMLAADPDFNFAPEVVAIDMQAVHATTTGGANALIGAADSVGTFRTQRKATKASTKAQQTTAPTTEESSNTATEPTTVTPSPSATPDAPTTNSTSGRATASVASSTGSRISSLNTFQTEITSQVTEQLATFRSDMRADMMGIMRDMLALQTGAQQIQILTHQQQQEQQQSNQQQQSAARQDNTGPATRLVTGPPSQVEQPVVIGTSDAGGPPGTAGAG